MVFIHGASILIFVLKWAAAYREGQDICPKYDDEDIPIKLKAVINNIILRTHFRLPEITHQSLGPFGGKFSLCISREDVEMLKSNSSKLNNTMGRYFDHQNVLVAASNEVVHLKYLIKSLAHHFKILEIYISIRCSCSMISTFDVGANSDRTDFLHFILYDPYACLIHHESRRLNNAFYKIARRSRITAIIQHIYSSIFSLTSIAILFACGAIIILAKFFIQKKTKTETTDRNIDQAYRELIKCKRDLELANQSIEKSKSNTIKENRSWTDFAKIVKIRATDVFSRLYNFIPKITIKIPFL